MSLTTAPQACSWRFRAALQRSVWLLTRPTLCRRGRRPSRFAIDASSPAVLGPLDSFMAMGRAGPPARVACACACAPRPHANRVGPIVAPSFCPHQPTHMAIAALKASLKSIQRAAIAGVAHSSAHIRKHRASEQASTHFTSVTPHHARATSTCPLPAPTLWPPAATRALPATARAPPVCPSFCGLGLPAALIRCASASPQP